MNVRMDPNGPDAKAYRRCVGIMLLNKQGHVFVGRRIDSNANAWQMPQGGIEHGESTKAAAIRELHEETGTDKAKFLAEGRDWFFYDLPADIQPKLWGGRYRGQIQLWFAMRFVGEDGDINIATAVPEFAEWKWIEPKDLPSVIVPFKRDLYQAVVDEFAPHLASADA